MLVTCPMNVTVATRIRMTTVVTPSGSRETTITHYCQTLTYHEVNYTRNGYRSGTHSYHHTEHRSHLSGNSRVHTLEEESKATMTHTEGLFSLRVCACM